MRLTARFKSTDPFAVQFNSGDAMMSASFGDVVRVAGSGGGVTEEELQAALALKADVFDVDGKTLRLQGGVLSVNTTNVAEADNTQPITSAGVNTIVGNIDALLRTI